MCIDKYKNDRQCINITVSPDVLEEFKKYGVKKNCDISFRSC